MAGNWGIVNRDEIHRFTFALEQYQQGTLSEEEFTAQRLQFGIYGQRQAHQYMVRIKIPGGILDREQLQCIGQLTAKYSNADFANITTRQDIQLHFVELKSVPKVLLRLSDVGLTTREACGNTVRNITACPMAGVCPQEHLDIRPLLNKTTIHFLRHPLTQHLPRKFKMSFSGCESDCAMGLIHDLAVVAVKKEDAIGFKILVGGGLGHKPKEAFVLEEFVEEKRVIAIIESVITLHNRYSDRTKRAKSRLKFLVERFGQKDFKEKYQRILSATESRFQKAELNQKGRKNHPLRWCNIDFKRRIEDPMEPKSTVRLSIALGDVSPAYVNRVCKSMGEFGLSQLRTTQGQDLLLLDVKDRDKPRLAERLTNIAEQSPAISGNVVACPGSWTCRLGITASRDMASVIASQIDGLRVNISGCHNSCAQPQISDIGLHGEGRRKFGKLLPYYRLYLGGDGSMNGGFALKGPELPAARVPSAIQLIEKKFRFEKNNLFEKSDGLTFRDWVKSKSLAYFDALLESFVEVSISDIPALMRDEGEAKDFRVLQLGGGECAGIAEETVAAYLSEIKYEKSFSEIFLRQSEFESALECAENILVLLAKSLLYKKGEIFVDDRNHIADSLKLKFSEQQLLIEGFSCLCERLDFLKTLNDKVLTEAFFRDFEVWHSIALKVINAAKENRTKELRSDVLDLTQDALPMQYLKAKQRFNRLENGKSLKIVLRPGPDVSLMFKGLESKGFQLLSLDENKEQQQTILHMLKPENFEKQAQENMEQA